MTIKGRITIIASIVLCLLLQAQGADKYTDGNRPYEFGFSIEGEQHRQEKKDEKGLIQGEFGFLTADGVYHVTVYATDEEGKFKILSMKNIRTKPYPTAKQSSTSVRQGHSLDVAAPPQTPTQATTLKPISLEPPGRSCSSCSIPTTSAALPAAPVFNPPISSSPNQIGTAGNPKFPKEVKPQSAFINQPSVSLPPQANVNYPSQPQITLRGPEAPLEQGLVAPPQSTQNFPPQGPSQISRNGIGIPQGPGLSNPLKSADSPSIPQQQPGTPENSAQYPGSVQPARENVGSGRTPKRLDGEPSFAPVGSQPNSLQRGPVNSQSAPAPPAKPTLISAQMQIVDKNTDIYRRGPGEKEGLPEGLTKDDMGRLLYTFNYTVGFHGHFEEGYTNGVKQGYYFITGRNGVKTRVDYVADSTGFHPKISQEVLDLLSDDVPKPETEKEDKYGLKGYEFKWLYYPVEAKGR